MNVQQFDSSDAERTQRMTEEETRAVIRRWQQEQVEQGGLTDKPALPDVAEGLNISVADAHRLLDEVRAEREAQERLLAQEQVAAELEQVRLAEEQRKLAEVQRQRAELQRQQTEAQRQQAQLSNNEQQWRAPQVQASNSLGTVVKVIFVIIWFVIMISIILSIASSPLSPFKQPPQSSCTLDNKPIPCSELPSEITNDTK